MGRVRRGWEEVGTIDFDDALAVVLMRVCLESGWMDSLDLAGLFGGFLLLIFSVRVCVRVCVRACFLEF